MLPDCDSATGAVSAASIRLREPAMQLPLTRLHEQAATAHPASVLARVAGIARHRGLLSCNLCPDGFAAAPPSEAGSGALRVVSYNLLCPAKFSSSEGAFRGGGCACERDAGPANWNPRLQLQARALATSGAHIICLQELATDEQALHVSFASNLPDYDVAAATIRRHDEDMVAILLRKPGTLGSSEPTEPILAVETSPDTGAPLVLSCHASERRAVCSIAIVKASYATGSFRVCIAAAHFRFVKPQSGAAEQERTRASKLAEATYFKHRAFEYAAKHGLDASRGDIVVFTGDLNMESAKPDGDARDRPVWEALSTPLMPDPAPGSDGGALVSALAVAEAGSAAGAGSGCFVSHVTRQGHQRGADFILLGAPVDGATCARGDPKRGLPRHPADRVAHASVMPYCMLPTARIPYPAVDGVFRIGEDALGRHWHKPNEMPEGVWAQLSDHRPILADILPPSGSLRPTA
jgi:endonuclease/exonuclease/phosphatase family metal-dependent hydrolase